ncbi:type IV secretory system conjugative DNA transfer family protein [Novosphingobium sp. FKTRR1]|uniref:type IV secretory system conjugative DNA transfer family protein n=1 Tax=Novosphingobium sp. FKTRR1 TaxID=2879118 RepID=UPI001CF04C36|nr:type IV secretory system conjugative DNA transfer family protein [Novosphingobium sp. FKTRR1]
MSDWTKNGGIYFGHKINDPETLHPSFSTLDLPWDILRDCYSYKSDRHIITIGPNGSGKTRRLLVPNLHRLTDWSVLVVDPKGTLAVQTAKHRHDAGNRIITLDPFGVISAQHPGLVDRLPYLKSAGLNPLAALDPDGDEFPDDAKALAEALIKIEGNEPHFSKSAQALVAGLIMALRVDKGINATLTDVREHLGLDAKALGICIKRSQKEIENDKKNGVETEPGYIDLYGKQYPAIAAKLSRFANISPENRELTGILSTAQTQTEWLDSAPVQRDLRQGVHDFGVMKSAPTTIYLILPPRYLETHGTWLRLIITAVLMPLIRTTGGRVPVLFMLDEFAQLGRMEVIERNMALMREYGVKLWPIFQDLSQAKDLYKERWESFIGNAGITQSFAPQDETTRDYLSKLSGLRTYWLRTTGASTGQSVGPQHSESSGTTSGWSHMQGPEYWGKGLARMEMGQAIMFNLGANFRTFLPDPEDAKWMPDTKRMLEAARSMAGAAPAVHKPQPAGKAEIACPHCRQKVRVPGNRGSIEVKCPSSACGRKWVYDPAA